MLPSLCRSRQVIQMDDHYLTALKGALITVLTLFGGILVGIGLGNLVFMSMPGHSVANALDPDHLFYVIDLRSSSDRE